MGFSEENTRLTAIGSSTQQTLKSPNGAVWETQSEWLYIYQLLNEATLLERKDTA